MPDAATDAAPPGAVLSVVVPMYDEQDVVDLLVERLRPVLDSLLTDPAAALSAYEVVAVDDGSGDSTPVQLQRHRRTWPQLRVVRLRANAGHQAAISAGLVRARGDWLVTLDADLQDPPELIADMVRAARAEDVDVVYGVRTDRASDTWFKRTSARIFYRVMAGATGQEVPANAGDYRLMSRATVDAVNALPEQHRVLRLVVPSLGFPSAAVGYRREARAAGRSKYPLATMVRLSVDSLTGFSLAPLRLATWVGLLGFLVATGFVAYAIASAAFGYTVPGWTSTVAIVAGVGAVQLLCLGVMGEYVGRIYATLQGRPSYHVAYDSARDTGPVPGRREPATPSSSSGTG